MTNNAPLSINTAALERILEAANALPEAGGGIELPELTNEGTVSDLLENKQFIDQDGNIVTGSMPNNGAISDTMDGINTKSISIPAGYTSGGSVTLDDTIDNEVDEQTDLIAQIRSAVDGLPEAGGGGNNTSDVAITIVGAAASRPAGYVDADSKTGITDTITTGKVFKLMNGAIAVFGGKVQSATCAYITATVRSGYYIHIFLASGEVSFT